MKFAIALAALGLCLAACAPGTPATPPLPTVALLPMPSATPTPAVALQIATPAPPPTYTPTPTPTPVTYLVKKGDTLGGIAYTYGISVEVLQAANPAVLPAFLSIGTVLTIPVVVEGGASSVAAAASPTPLPVMLAAGPVCYPQVTGALYCLVEARNPGAAPLQSVAAQVALIGPKGEVLASQVAYSALDVILPGNGSPLAAWFPNAPPAMVAPVAQVVSAEPAIAGAAPATPLDVSAPRLATPPAAGSGVLWTVTGQVKNGSAAAVASVRLVLTLYDGQKQMVGYRTAMLPVGLAVGSTEDFSISAASLGGPVEDYAIAAEGRP